MSFGSCRAVWKEKERERDGESQVEIAFDFWDINYI